MASTANIKTEIITQLNFLPEKSLDEVKMFIQFLFFERQTKQKTNINKDHKSSESDFFKICGIWQERDIDSNSLRRKAWRKIKW